MVFCGAGFAFVWIIEGFFVAFLSVLMRFFVPRPVLYLDKIGGGSDKK